MCTRPPSPSEQGAKWQRDEDSKTFGNWRLLASLRSHHVAVTCPQPTDVGKRWQKGDMSSVSLINFGRNVGNITSQRYIEYYETSQNNILKEKCSKFISTPYVRLTSQLHLFGSSNGLTACSSWCFQVAETASLQRALRQVPLGTSAAVCLFAKKTELSYR